MAKYRKTALIEATQFDGATYHPAIFVGAVPGEYVIKTLEGPLTVLPGTWIAGPGPKGEYWPIDPEVFAATYEKVND